MVSLAIAILKKKIYVYNISNFSPIKFAWAVENLWGFTIVDIVQQWQLKSAIPKKLDWPKFN